MSRRPNWNTHARRALPINKYPEFSRLHGAMPGANTAARVWVQAVAEGFALGNPGLSLLLQAETKGNALFLLLTPAEYL